MTPLFSVGKEPSEEVQAYIAKEQKYTQRLWQYIKNTITTYCYLNKAKTQQIDRKVKTLIAKNANIEAADVEGKTLLHIAAFYQNTYIAEILLDNGANIDACDDKGRTPLHYAAHNGQKEMITLLLDKGANPAAQDCLGNTPLHTLMFNGDRQMINIFHAKNDLLYNIPNHNQATALHLAAGAGNVSCVSKLLALKADPTAPDTYGSQVAHYMAANKDSLSSSGVATALLKEKHGIDINCRDKKGNTLLMYAALNNNSKLIKKLCYYRAKVDDENKQHQTALHYTTLEDAILAAEALLKAKADPNKFDHCHETPLHYAAAKNNLNLVRMLLNYKADVTLTNKANKTADKLTINPIIAKKIKASGTLLGQAKRRCKQLTGTEARKPSSEKPLRTLKSRQRSISW